MKCRRECSVVTTSWWMPQKPRLSFGGPRLYWLHFASAVGSASFRPRTRLVRSAGSGDVVTMTAAVSARLRTVALRAAARLKATFRRLTRPLPLVTGVAGDLLRTRRELIAENALLRQQLIIASRKVKRPAFQPHERGLLVLLACLVPRWRDALLLVKPETVLRWHRAGFRLFWRHRSKPDARREPRLPRELIALIGTGAPDELSGRAVSTERQTGVPRSPDHLGREPPPEHS